MKPLSEMTRKELEALSYLELGVLCERHNVKWNSIPSIRKGPCYCENCVEEVREQLNSIRLELQQDKAAK